MTKRRLESTYMLRWLKSSRIDGMSRGVSSFFTQSPVGDHTLLVFRLAAISQSKEMMGIRAWGRNALFALAA